MAEYTALAPLFTDIANAIRSKTGETGAITANTFPEKINQIELGTPEVSVANKHTQTSKIIPLPYIETKGISVDKNVEILVVCILAAANGPNGNWKYTTIAYKCLPDFYTRKGDYKITTNFVNSNSLYVKVDSTISNYSPQMQYLGIMSFI